MFRGVAFSLVASILFGIMYYLSTHLSILGGEGIYGFRIWVTLPFILAALFAFKQWDQFKQFIQQLKQQPKLIMVLLVTSFITGSQMWLFLWAPNNNAAIDVSIGYLLMPIAMVVVGRCCFKEQLSPLKIASITFAVIGVMSMLISLGTISWATLMVVAGYPIYFSLRKYFAIAHLSSFTCEMILMLPVASYFIAQIDLEWVVQQQSDIYLWLALLGLVSGVALICYVTASSIVPINVMGLLSYVEPVSMLTVSFIIGEVLDRSSYILMICLSLAVLLLLLDGFVVIAKQRRVKSC